MQWYCIPLLLAFLMKWKSLSVQWRFMINKILQRTCIQGPLVPTLILRSTAVLQCIVPGYLVIILGIFVSAYNYSL